MGDKRVERRLAAILAADVVGYSRLVGIDEEGTLAALKALRKSLIDPKVTEHRGRIVKNTGDGALVEFASAVDAVQCAVETQREMANRTNSIPEDRRIEFRIGINIGDIVIEEGDIFGDGVNIAVRLESIAAPGGVCISEDVYRQVRGKFDAAFEDMGEQKLKNIVQSVRVYRVRIGGSVGNSTGEHHSTNLPLPDKPSIAVLAFQNMSGEVEQEYFADGIAEDIITALSKSRWLFVIARNSSFTYKGRAVDIKQIGRELGVRYVLEGSVRKSGNRARITTQLIEAATGAHMWAERYDRDLADIFAVQDEITGSVTNAIEPAMAQAEQQRVSRKLPDSLDAWEAYHRGLWHILKHEPSENDQAKTFFQRAIDLDSSFAPGYYGLALTHLWEGAVLATRPLRDSLSVARPLAQRALTLDDADSMAHFVMGIVFMFSGDSAGARLELDRAISINPNNAWAVGASGSLFGNNGRLSEALDAIGKAMRASPHDPLMWVWMLYVIHSNYFARNYQAALDAADRLIRFRPDKPQAYRWRAATLGQLGRKDEAKVTLEQAIVLSPTNFHLHVRARPPWFRSEDHALLLEGLRKAGLPDEHSLSLPDKPSIAVLAFQNMSGDPEQEYFADGIAEDIITALSKLRWLFVIARNSSFTYKGRSVDIKQISRELGVRYVLEGSVRKSGNRVRITSQLVEAATGVHLWAERYDRNLTDIFAVQDEITESVAMAIEPAMAEAERLRVSRKPPDSLVAWEAYHRGLWHFLKQEPSENDQAKEFFQRAIDLDPGFAGGFYGLALTHIWDCWVYVSRPVQDSVSVALPLAQRALKLDDADPMAHFVTSCVLMISGDVDEAVPFAQQAVSLNPNNAWAVGFLGGLSNLVDYLGDGLAGLRKAIRISPHDPMLWTWTHWLAIGHYFARDYSAALEASDRVIRLRPDKPQGYRWKAAALGQLGRIEEARKALQRAIEISPEAVQFYKRTPPWYQRRSADYARLLEGLQKAGLLSDSRQSGLN